MRSWTKVGTLGTERDSHERHDCPPHFILAAKVFPSLCYRSTPGAPRKQFLRPGGPSRPDSHLLPLALLSYVCVSHRFQTVR